MLEHHSQTTASINRELSFLFPLQFNKEDKQKIPIPSGQNTSVWHDLNFEEEIETETTQELADSQMQRLVPTVYDEEDVLYWDAAITTAPHRPSGTIRVKLKYKEQRKPSPFDDYWEE